MRHCEYAKPNGTFCGSPALRGRDYCHWHLTCVARRLHMEKQAATCDPTPLALPPLEDANSIQLALMMVTDAILHDRVGPKKGNQLLYALQLASNNLRQGVNFHPVAQAAPVNKEDKHETEEVVLCSSYNSLEADYDIAEHHQQLKATHPEVEFGAAQEQEEKQEEEEQPEQDVESEEYEEKIRNDVEMFLGWANRQGYGGFRDNFDRNHPDFDLRFAEWKEEIRRHLALRRQVTEEERRKQEEAEELRQQEYKLLWEEIAEDLSVALAGDDPEELPQALARCYRCSGLEYETAGWKPAARQLVLFPRKPPAGVQQQWHEQRHANCTAEIDQAIADQEAARKKIS
jgi:hypothetical protein